MVFHHATIVLLIATPVVLGSSIATDHITTITVGATLTSSCTINSWVDFALNVTADLTDSNLLFEVEDTGSSYNPTGLSVSLWSYAVPSDRKAEHRTDRAAGKVQHATVPDCSLHSCSCLLPACRSVAGVGGWNEQQLLQHWHRHARRALRHHRHGIHCQDRRCPCHHCSLDAHGWRGERGAEPPPLVR